MKINENNTNIELLANIKDLNKNFFIRGLQNAWFHSK